MEELLSIFEFIKKVIDKKQNYNDARFKEYIVNVYYDTKIIYEDLIRILFCVKSEVKLNKMTIASAVLYIENSRVPLKALRQELSSKTIVAFFNNDAEEDMIMFAIGVRGILQGGMVGDYSNNNWVIIERYYKKLNKKEEGLLLYQGRHTLADLVDRFSREGYASIYNDRYMKKYPWDDKYVHKRFLEELQSQINSIEKYWKLVTIAYAKLTYQKYN